MHRTFLAVAIHLSLAVSCSATNGYFIPGDAFFHFEIDQAEWKELEGGRLSILSYDRPEELTSTLGGKVGYQNLDIANLPEKYRARFVAAVRRMKEKYPTKIVEIDHGDAKFLLCPSGVERKEVNKIRVFVYNRSFDLSRFRFGLKYNETWPDAGAALGVPKEHFWYDFFVPQGIGESWRMGSEVSPLAVQLPDDRRGRVTEPMRIDPSEIKFVICPPTPLTSLYDPPRDENLECFVVSREGTATLKNDKSRKHVWNLVK